MEANSGLGNAANAIEINGGQLQITGTTFNTLNRSITMAGSGSIDVADANSQRQCHGRVKHGDGHHAQQTGCRRVDAVECRQLRREYWRFRWNTEGDFTPAVWAQPLARQSSRGARRPALLELAGGVTVTGETLRSGRTRIRGGNCPGPLQRRKRHLGWQHRRHRRRRTSTTSSRRRDCSRSPVTSPPPTDSTAVYHPLTGAGNGRITGAILDPTASTRFSTTLTCLKRALVPGPLPRLRALLDDYHRGTTTIAEGRLAVTSGVGDVGELASSEITVQSGAVFDVSDFGTYSLQVGQRIGGSGTIDGGGSTTSGLR